MSLRLGKKGFLICFTGIEGSGKTTHAKTLTKYLTKRGYFCTYVWAASKPILTYMFYVGTQLFKFWRKTDRNVFIDPLELAPKGVRNKLSAIWLFLLFVDFQIRTTLRIRTKLASKKIVVCDRYVFDLLMELILCGLHSERFGKLILRTVPSPSLTFLMDVPETVASKRRNSSPNLFSERRRIYLDLAKKFNFIVLDTYDDFVTNVRKIREKTIPLIQKTEVP